MNFPIELYVDGVKRTVVLDDLSRTGMFVRVTEPLAVGTVVHAVIATIPNRPRVLTAGTVVHVIDERDAAALGRQAGAGIRFREPVNARDTQFAEVIADMVNRHIRVAKQPAHRIVVADHHPRVVEQLSDLLARANFAVAVATTGPEVLSACYRHAPDVVLIDRQLPLIDGFGLLPQLTVPTILTSYDHGDFARAFELGAADFIPKPFTGRELIARARRIVHTRQKIALRGELSDLSMTALLTMLEQSRKTGRLALSRTSGEVATIDIVDGKIVGARCAELSAREVLDRTLDWTDATFELASTTPTATNVSMSITHLLLDHARIADELARAG